jgi:hypothetical protein
MAMEHMRTRTGLTSSTRALQVVFAVTAALALFTFAHVLKPGDAQISVASGSLRTLNTSAGKRITPPAPPAPPAPPRPPETAAADDGSADVAPDADADADEDQQEARQQEEQDDEQAQQQQSELQVEQQTEEANEAAQEQNEEAQAQATQDIVQAEQSDPQVIQDSQRR